MESDVRGRESEERGWRGEEADGAWHQYRMICESVEVAKMRMRAINEVERKREVGKRQRKEAGTSA